MNPEKVVFAFFIILSLTLNLESTPKSRPTDGASARRLVE